MSEISEGDVFVLPNGKRATLLTINGNEGELTENEMPHDNHRIILSKIRKLKKVDRLNNQEISEGEVRETEEGSVDDE